MKAYEEFYIGTRILIIKFDFMKIAVMGTGYVGLVTSVSLANSGHRVICVGRNKEKILSINSGKSPFFEPGLDSLLGKLVKKGLITATDNLEKSVASSNFTIIAVGTPTIKGKIDLSEITTVSKQIGKALRNIKEYHVVVVRSTVVPGTTELTVKPLLEKYSKKAIGKDFGLCMNPEFLREGNAVTDALNPDRIVIGQYDNKSGVCFSKIFDKSSCPKVLTTLKTAEITKYAANSLLATMISYSNEISCIVENVGDVDIVDVWKGVHLDGRLSPVVGGKRIRPGFLNYILSGCGYGGSCFPKDTKALLNFSKRNGYTPSLIQSVISINETQPERLIALLSKELGSLKNKKIAVWGLTFKPDTDDIRESPALSVIKLLDREDAKIACHDPLIKKIKGKLTNLPIEINESALNAIKNADGLIVVTAWDEYGKYLPEIFIKNMKRPIIVDGRRIFNKEKFKKAGIIYKGIGLGN